MRYILSHNLHRCHLTTSQRASIAVEALPMFEEDARKRQAATQIKDGGPPAQSATTGC